MERGRACTLLLKADGIGWGMMCRVVSKVVGAKAAPSIVTLGYIALWYGLNVAFNLQNKVIFNYFPYPWFVSTIHVVVGAIYCTLMYFVGAKQASFQRVRVNTCLFVSFFHHEMVLCMNGRFLV